MPSHHLCLDLGNLLAQGIDHSDEQSQGLARKVREWCIVFVQRLSQLAHMGSALGGNDPELRKVSTQCAYLRGALSDEQVAGTMQHQHALSVY